ncbi:MAG TPA: hypothetical protein VIM57_05830 [Luteolibacter sp.]
MKRWPCLVFAAVATVAFAQETTLPEWDEADRAAVKKGEKGGFFPGGFLLTAERPWVQADEPQPEPLAVEPPAADEIAGDREPEHPVPESFWSAYFAQRPDGFLVDPQKLLKPEQHAERARFLKDHAGDSTIDFYLYVFDGEQSIPGEVRAEELIERCFQSGRPAAVVFYFLGAPERTELRFSPAIAEIVSPLEQRRSLQSSVTLATEKSGAAEQLEAFCQQMSIRLYWIERLMKGGVENVVGVSAPLETNAKKTSSEKKEKLLALARQWAPQAAAAAGALLLLSSLRWLWKAKAKYRFPEFEVEPRLGGDHAAGIGAVISFASAALPPGGQREQKPEYLHRA